MAVTVKGNVIAFSQDNDTVTLNCPIKKIIGGVSVATSFNIFIDSELVTLSVNNGREVEFPSLNGYPGVTLTTTKACTVIITEIGDVLNPNYFKEDIRNWNGQGAAAVATAAETEAVPTVAKATRPKKAEVTE